MGSLTNGDSTTRLVTKDDNRIEHGSVNILPATFPETSLPSDLDPKQVAQDFVSKINTHLQSKTYTELASRFSPEGAWRDHLCLSWELRTLTGPEKIAGFLKSQGQRLQNVELDDSAPHKAPVASALDAFGKSPCVAFFINVTTDVGSGRGVARVAYQGRSWTIVSLYTALRELKGHEEAMGARRPNGASHGGDRNMKNWAEQRQSDIDFEERDPAVLVIGAGQGGLTSAARLRFLNVPTLVIDRNSRVGDNWRQRYRQLVLHDPVWFDHMPYMEFPQHWPIFTPKDKLAQFFEAYVDLLELNVWTRTSLVDSSWSDAEGRWTVTLERTRNIDGQDRKETRVMHPRHIITATGHSGKKNMPDVPGMADFKGHLLCHSSEFPGARPNSQGKRAIVVGSCNSGHDIAQDLYENGYDVTMVQRSSTCVVSSKAIVDIALGSLYSEAVQAKLPVDDADLLLWSTPTPISKAQQVQVTQLANEHDRELLQGLQKVGFQLDKGTDGAGLFYKYFQRGGGYYIDVGASSLIVEGKIAVKSGVEISSVQPNGLEFADGTTIEADEIVFATGYQNMRTQARVLLGDEAADRCQDVWGFNEEGEFRCMWQSSGHPGLWFMGGNLALSRYFGRFLALKIKALEEGLTK